MSHVGTEAVAGPAADRHHPPGTAGDHRPLLTYFLLTFLWTWSWWGAVAVMGLPVTEGGPGALLYLLGVLGPLAGAAWMVRRASPAYRREFLLRIWDPRRIRGRWWLALLAVTAGPAAIAAGTTSLIGTAGTVPDYSLGAIVGVAAVALVAGLAEEPGWRGAAADAWQARTRPMWAATGIGALWAIWHLPLGLIEGHYYHDLGVGSVRFWLSYLMLTQLGVLYCWLVNGAGGSILIAILAHAGTNVALNLAPGSTTRDLVAFLVISTATVWVVATTKGRLRFELPAPPEGAPTSGHPTEHH